VRLAVAAAVLPGPLFALYTYGALHFVYSHGDRVGFLQKLSERGWLCKTWEGELAMVNLPGQAAEVFTFTVRDPAVVEKLRGLEGQRVAISYEQHKGVPSSCFGETEYYIIDGHKTP
jgi:hypothetical protein